MGDQRQVGRDRNRHTSTSYAFEASLDAHGFIGNARSSACHRCKAT